MTSPGSPFPKVLVVDDSFIIRKLVSEIRCQRQGFRPLLGQAENGKAALRLVREVKPDLACFCSILTCRKCPATFMHCAGSACARHVTLSSCRR